MAKKPAPPKPAPPNTPEGKIGERVRLRANHLRSGAIARVPMAMWANVDWDDGHDAHKIWHLHELVALPIDT